MANNQVQNSLMKQFNSRDVKYALSHFSRMIEDFQKGEWENSISKGGKFIEAVLKGLIKHVGQPCAQGRAFKAGRVIEDLGRLSKGSADDVIRLTIPRACEFVYDIASNRGGRHDPYEVDPNRMDSIVTVACCSWILAEMVRYAEKGAIDLEEAETLVEALVERKYPLIEDIEGRVYVHLKSKSARDAALLLLAYRHPQRMPKQDLITSVKRNGFSEANSRMAVQRIRFLIDNDGQDNLRLLQPGLQAAEELIRQGSIS